jgi:hypothetical protein
MIGIKVFVKFGASTLYFSNTETHVGKLPPKNDSYNGFDIVLDWGLCLNMSLLWF